MPVLGTAPRIVDDLGQPWIFGRIDDGRRYDPPLVCGWADGRGLALDIGPTPAPHGRETCVRAYDDVWTCCAPEGHDGPHCGVAYVELDRLDAAYGDVVAWRITTAV